MYENESYESKAQSDWTRDERDLDAHLERQEARARRDLAEGLIELSEFTGQLPRLAFPNVAAPVATALDGWLKAMSANAWGYGQFTPAKPAAIAQRSILNEREAA